MRSPRTLPALGLALIVPLVFALANSEDPQTRELASSGGEPRHLAWRFTTGTESAGFVAREGTPPAKRSLQEVRYAPAEVGGGVVLNEARDAFQVWPGSSSELQRLLPREHLTLTAWVAVERTQRWGGIISCLEDNGGQEKGFLLGYENEFFAFALATEGADDGDGLMTYLRGRTPIRLGSWHHVAATYDGKIARLYVDGVLDGETRVQSGPLLHAPTAPLVLGGYRDSNENHPLDGRLLGASIRPSVLGAGRIAKLAESRIREAAAWTDLAFGWLVPPFLTWPTTDAMSINFETSFPSRATVTAWRDDASESEGLEFVLEDRVALRNVRVTPLEPDAKYFYRVKASNDAGATIDSGVLSFRTAASAGKPFTFVVIGDTQPHGQAERAAIIKTVSDLAYEHRPNLLVHAGDLVDTGTSKRDWTDLFFPNMQPLIARTPMMPVLGNHEQDAKHYYDYMSLPDPERWYSFTYGDAEFFMIDGNRSLQQRSEQLRWLEGALKGSKARWRFAVLHQPPYTSDSNDYGDTTKGPSRRGDPNVRNIVRLLERYDVDVCFSGHVHDYERTFPIKGNEVVPYEAGGVIYVTAAGGGGSLEDFDPANTWFGHKKARKHHLVYVAIHHDELELQAVDLEGRLFDTLRLDKRGR